MASKTQVEDAGLTFDPLAAVSGKLTYVTDTDTRSEVCETGYFDAGRTAQTAAGQSKTGVPIHIVAKDGQMFDVLHQLIDGTLALKGGAFRLRALEVQSEGVTQEVDVINIRGVT